eukprot:m.134909 g.134909  ORF g.134909 m.134909 type:complete len:66 (-) comp15831_c0_seq1:823-1020(-)
MYETIFFNFFLFFFGLFVSKLHGMVLVAYLVFSATWQKEHDALTCFVVEDYFSCGFSTYACFPLL